MIKMTDEGRVLSFQKYVNSPQYFLPKAQILTHDKVLDLKPITDLVRASGDITGFDLCALMLHPRQALGGHSLVTYFALYGCDQRIRDIAAGKPVLI